MTKIDPTQTPAITYEAPRLVELGKLHELTLGTDKSWGASDGLTFQGTPIAWSSA